MRDHAIAPTAQRLAEENNVDWRFLEGSGEGGSVVERDVLGYLARVTSGEEATNPTPEPLPEGLSAWPEEPERRRNTQGQTQNRTQGRNSASQSLGQSSGQVTPSRSAPKATPDRAENRSTVTTPGAAPFTVPAPVTVTNLTSDAAPNTPWTVEKPVKATPADSATSFNSPNVAGDANVAADNAISKETAPRAISNGAAARFETVTQPAPEAAKPTQSAEAIISTSPDLSAAEDAKAAQAQTAAVLAELETLRERVAELEEERLRHVNELHQLSRMQETIALQKNEGAKLGTLQSEIRDLKAQLTAAQRSGERVEALATHNRDLESRLVRARNFKSKAKLEFERITEDNIMLEHELADLKRSKRGLFRRKN